MSTQLSNWLNQSGLSIESLSSEMPHSVLSPLTDYSVIRVSGQDAEKFMQGQFSCDVREVGLQQSRMGTANTPKGRAYGVFRIAKQGDDYLIRLPSSIADDFCQRLNKYIVFSKATLTLDEDLCVLGFSGDPASLANLMQTTTELPSTVDSSTQLAECVVISVPSDQTKRFEIWGSIHNTTAFLSATQSSNDLKVGVGSQSFWNWEEVNQGIAEIYPATQESYIPQMLNLQHFNAISFKKGCYTGQEIVARMKYLGKIKKEMFLLSASDITTIEPGTDLIEKDSGKKVGSVVRAACPTTLHPEANHCVILAVLAIDAVNSNTQLSLEASSRTLNMLKLPYQADESNA